MINLSILRRTIAVAAGTLLLASATPALAAAPAGPTAAKPPHPVFKLPKLTPKRTKKKRLALARTHVRKTVADAQMGEPLVLSPLDRYVDDNTTMELYGVELQSPNEEYAYVEPYTDNWWYSVLVKSRSQSATTYLVDCLVMFNPEFEVLSLQADPDDYLLEHAEQIFSGKIKLQEQTHISFSLRPAANKNFYIYFRSTNKLQFALQRCEITPIAD